MNNWQYRLPCKIVAIVLAILLWSLTVLLGLGLAAVTWMAGSENTADSACRSVVSPFLNNYCYDVCDFFDYSNRSVDSSALRSHLDGENYYVTLTFDNQVIFSNYQNEKYWTAKTRDFSFLDEEGNESILTVHLYLKNKLPKQDWCAIAVNITAQLFRFRATGTVLCLFGVLLGFTAAAFLCCTVARRADNPAVPVCNAWNRLPTDISALLFAAPAALLFVLFIDIMETGDLAFFLLPLIVVAAVSLLIFCLLDIAARVKTHTFWTNTVIRRIGLVIVQAGRAAVRGIRALPLIPKTVCGIVVILLLELFVLLMNWDTPDLLILTWVLEKLLLIPLVLWFSLSLCRVRRGISRIADGELTCQIPTTHLIGDVKAAADDLNRIGGGLQKAVDARLKSERLRTELITNVSHDIKTPLTSIISYVDLMKKENPENENIKTYIDVLDRQSTRLKKLIVDLVEASKASTGNLTVDFAPCDLGTLLTQMVGEYTERFAAADLTPVLHLPEDSAVILADSRHLWRVFDNLMNNICKYALPGTRVYLDLLKNGDQAICIFRNISRSELTAAPDELTERFVRGDSSRNTEGSGLGLSIASSLTALQKGRLDITTDGDLFKVILTFSMPEGEKG